MKSPVFKLLLLVLLAAFFYDDPQLFLWKRILYSAFLYLSLFQLGAIYIGYANKGVQFPTSFKVFGFFYLCFIVGNTLFSLFSPSLNLVTLFNNPYALLSAIPLFSFGVGYAGNEKDVTKVLSVACGLFLVSFLIPSYSNPPYYAGYVCSAALIPAFVFAYEKKKNIVLFSALLLVGCVYSYISDYRIIMLKVIMFAGLFVAFNFFKRNTAVKFLIISVTSFFTFQVVTNFEKFLTFFQTLLQLKKFDVTDTRTFLYEELFADLKGSEIIYGRGFLGSYFSKYFLELQVIHHTIADTFNRYSIEVGFLELILKGGLIYAFFYFTPLLYSSLKSLLRAQTDSLTFNLGIYIFVEVIAMFIENIPLYNFEFFVLFFVAGFLYRKLNAPKRKRVLKKPEPMELAFYE